jgi:hypothetical protein
MTSVVAAAGIVSVDVTEVQLLEPGKARFEART